MDEIRTVEVLNEDEDGNPVAVIVRDPLMNNAVFHVLMPVLTHTPSGPVMAPTAFAWCLN
jgi:hypothetical protein